MILLIWDMIFFLTASIYSWQNVKQQRLSTWSSFCPWENWFLDEELPLSSPLTKCIVSRLDKQVTSKKTAKHCQDRTRQFLKFSSPWKLFVSYSRTYSKFMAPLLQWRLWVIAQVTGCLSFLVPYGNYLIALLVYSSNIISLLKILMGFKTR